MILSNADSAFVHFPLWTGGCTLGSILFPCPKSNNRCLHCVTSVRHMSRFKVDPVLAGWFGLGIGSSKLMSGKMLIGLRSKYSLTAP